MDPMFEELFMELAEELTPMMRAQRIQMLADAVDKLDPKGNTYQEEAARRYDLRKRILDEIENELNGAASPGDA